MKRVFLAALAVLLAWPVWAQDDCVAGPDVYTKYPPIVFKIARCGNGQCLFPLFEEGTWNQVGAKMLLVGDGKFVELEQFGPKFCNIKEFEHDPRKPGLKT